MIEEYNSCTLCPRRCLVNRNMGDKGFCGADSNLKVNKISLHFMEEPVISGEKGSGTVFFTHCNLGCIFCQNKDISRPNSFGDIYSAESLAEEFIKLESKGANNINLVSPTHYMPTILKACIISRKKGIKIPFVYNTSGFELPENIKKLDEVIDIFLTDLKYSSPYLSNRYSCTEDYFDFTQETITQMVNITGSPEYYQNGLLKRGTIIRHLMLPGQLSDTKTILRKIYKNYGDTVLTSLMRQYTPVGMCLPDQLNRTVTDEEYSAAVEEFELLGLTGFLQGEDSVGKDKIPNFKV